MQGQQLWKCHCCQKVTSVSRKLVRATGCGVRTSTIPRSRYNFWSHKQNGVTLLFGHLEKGCFLAPTTSLVSKNCEHSTLHRCFPILWIGQSRYFAFFHRSFLEKNVCDSNLIPVLSIITSNPTSERSVLKILYRTYSSCDFYGLMTRLPKSITTGLGDFMENITN